MKELRHVSLQDSRVPPPPRARLLDAVHRPAERYKPLAGNPAAGTAVFVKRMVPAKVVMPKGDEADPQGGLHFSIIETQKHQQAGNHLVYIDGRQQWVHGDDIFIKAPAIEMKRKTRSNSSSASGARWKLVWKVTLDGLQVDWTCTQVQNDVWLLRGGRAVFGFNNGSEEATRGPGNLDQRQRCYGRTVKFSGEQTATRASLDSVKSEIWVSPQASCQRLPLAYRATLYLHYV